MLPPFFVDSVGLDGGDQAARGPGAGASSWLGLLKIFMRAVRLAVDRFHVLRWLNANVSRTMDAGARFLPHSR